MHCAYHSGQQTILTAKLWTKIVQNEQFPIFVSSPEFNLPKTDEQKEAWKLITATISPVNETCFGEIAENAALFAKTHGHSVEYAFVERAMTESLEKASYLLASLEANGFIELHRKVNAYVDGLREIADKTRSINTVEDWDNFTKSFGLPYPMNLHLDHYLKNFDSSLTDEQIALIYSHSEKLRYRTRWFTKLGVNAVGCYTDVVNLRAVLEQKYLPQYFVMDGENDDVASLKILTELNNNVCRVLNVWIQLPESLKDNADALEKICMKIFGTSSLPANHEFLFDPESRNLGVLTEFYNL